MSNKEMNKLVDRIFQQLGSVEKDVRQLVEARAAIASPKKRTRKVFNEKVEKYKDKLKKSNN